MWTRTVQCMSPLGIVLTDDDCFDIPPVASAVCNDFDCRFTFVLGTWGACDAICGGGHRYRTYTCQDSFGKLEGWIRLMCTVIVVVWCAGNVAPSDAYCSNTASTTVSLSEPCNTQPCGAAQYVLTSIGDCSAPCIDNNGNVPTVAVNVTCYANNVLVDLSVCQAAIPGPVPPSLRQCNAGRCR